jgi:hypothetical protein
MNVALVPKEDYITIFPLIEDYLIKAAKFTYGRYGEQDIKNDLLTKKQQLWIAFEGTNVFGFVVTEIITYPKMKTLIMHFTAGKELSLWKDDMLAELRDFAKLNDCKVIESYGRKGWAKVFKQDGYNTKFIFYELPVEN